MWRAFLHRLGSAEAARDASGVPTEPTNLDIPMEPTMPGPITLMTCRAAALLVTCSLIRAQSIGYVDVHGLASGDGSAANP
ncbi:MAG: hypothetical protein ACI841_002412 [Planctomycetota bacterium]|jgi:hypothetical protein